MRVIKETMRLYPPAWGILRQAAEDDVIDDWQIKKGDAIVLAPYAVHRMEKYWSDPEKFDPDRFLSERMKDKPKYAYFPFGGGQRLCIGNNFALLEMQAALAILCQRFDFSVPENFKLELEATVTLRPKNGVQLRIENLVKTQKFASHPR
jgi:cytochrome P450